MVQFGAMPDKGRRMASTAGDMARNLIPTLLGPGTGESQFDEVVRSDPTVYALAIAGLTALIALPLLMLASLLLGPPLAAPALIACGNLAVAAALAHRLSKTAAALNAGMLSGLIAWSIFYCLGADAAGSPSVALVASLAPAFAAAPAVARFLLEPRQDNSGEAACAETRSLEKMAPVAESEPGGLLRIDVRAEDNVEVRTDKPAIVDEACIPSVGSATCDLSEALAFSLSRVGGRLEQRGIALVTDMEPSITVAGDRQAIRRIAHRLVECIIRAASSSDVIRVSVRRLKGAALLRVTGKDVADEAAAKAPIGEDLASIRTLIDEAGGTVVVERSGDLFSLSARLGLAVA
jgi:hypothetical protein